MLHHLRGKHRYVHKGYILLYYPEHPNSWKNGLVYLHRLKVENHLGRYLLPGEHVHHKDGNIQNNRISNLEIMTPALHSYSHMKYLVDIECSVCGKMFSPPNSRQKTCSVSCGRRYSRKTEWPSKDELLRFVWSEPSSSLSKKFGVSGKTIENWCKFYGITKPARGYWQKRRAKNNRAVV